MMPRVSLVFPCYHAGHHMQHVLDDLQAQTFKEFEAILVNDGDDNQTEAMKEIASKDNRIRIVHRDRNGGVAAARNSGTEAVTTQWVTWPDPDDRFNPNYLNGLYQAVDGTGVQMGCGGYSLFNVKHGKTDYYHINTKHSPEIVEMAIGYERMGNFGYVWNKLYNVEIIRENALYMDTSLIFLDDRHFNLRYFQFVEKVGLVTDCGYIYYRYDKGKQLTTQYTPHHMLDWQKVIDLQTIYERHISWSEQKVLNSRTHIITIAVRSFFRNLFFFDSKKTHRESLAILQRDFFDQPEYVNAIKQGKFGKDNMLQLIQLLTRIGSAQLTTIIFKALSFVTRKMGISIGT